MKKFISIGINLFVIAICMYVLNKNDIHVMRADSLNKNSGNSSLSTNVGAAIMNNNDSGAVTKKDSNSNVMISDNMGLNIASANVKKPDVQANTSNTSQQNVQISAIGGTTLETQVGTMSAYGPNCAGCSGHLGGGFDASGGNYIYNDLTYGNVRIVAGDPKYPYGTMIKVSNSKLGEFNAIVLDRGGAIGIGRRFMFDLLFASEAEAASFGTSYDVVFEVLRYGY